MASNLFKPEAKRQRDIAGVRDALLGFLVLILFILAVIYLGYRVGEEGNVKQPVKNQVNN